MGAAKAMLILDCFAFKVVQRNQYQQQDECYRAKYERGERSARDLKEGLGTS